MLNSKKQINNILLIIFLAIVLLVTLQNINVVIDAIVYIIKLFSPFILGLCLAFILNVFMKKIEQKWFGRFKNTKKWSKIKRPIAIILTLFIVFGLVVLLLFLVIPELKNTIEIFINNIPIYQAKSLELANKLNLSASTIEDINTSWKNLWSNVTGYFTNNSKDIIEVTLGLTSSIFASITNAILSIVFAIYMLANKENLISQTKKVLTAFVPKNKIGKILEVGTISNRVFSNFITGQVIEALIIGVLCFIGMLIIGLPYALTISVLVGFTSLIPVFGAFIGTAIGAVLIFVVSPIDALIFIIFIIVLQQFEGNLIYPKVVGTSVGLPAIWVLLAIIIGGSIYGVIGMLIGVPLCSIVYTLLSKFVNERLAKKKYL
ncbi:MAG: AI-2E family transporter [Bacilli bacterium]|nr:AI-2E family transporter [Bacilli bacterium]MDD3895708.1 AI-2E family transporter [Bacilli bacterium]MDD4407724.1 AI-2E family transporter [Bacilli bacterium]